MPATDDSNGQPRMLLSMAGLDIWDESAPRKVREAHAAGDPGAWELWSRHLANRRDPIPPRRLLAGGRVALCWALPDEVEHSRTADLLNRLGHLKAKCLAEAASDWQREAYQWLATAESCRSTTAYALESIGWCHALPDLAPLLSAEAWWRLLNQLISAAQDAESLPAEFDPLTGQLVGGELPLTLSYLFPELAACRALTDGAHAELSRGLADILDGEGLPNSQHWDIYRPLLACWTRARAIGSRRPEGCWDQNADEQYRWLVEHALRVSRPDGSQVLTSDSAGRWNGKLIKSARRLLADEAIDSMARLSNPNKKSTTPSLADALPTPAVHSEWAEFACLRSDWPRFSPRLSVAYAGRQVRSEFSVGKHLLWSGDWGLDVQCDGLPAEQVSNWEEVCWVSDDDVDYVEIECRLTGDLRVQRQILLAKQQQFLFLADAVLGPHVAALEHTSTFPLTDETAFDPANETREGRLTTGKPRALVMPLALPEWRSDVRAGALAVSPRGLELRQHGQRQCLFSPLFIDFDAKRSSKPATWRQLTVAEARVNQPADVAVGFRVQVGKTQWVIYRSLARQAVRTVLGQNLSTEFLIGRFRSTGDVDTLLEIE